jgi:epoxide hydrolase 4
MGGEGVYLRGADGVRLHAVQAGTGQLVVLLHGFPQFWYLWRRQIEPLGELFHVVAPDTRGINLSSGPPDLNAYRPDRLVEDVRAIADDFGVERFHLVGHDFGGIISWAFALTYPRRLDRLVVMSAPHPDAFQVALEHDAEQQRASRYFNSHQRNDTRLVERFRADEFAFLDAGAIDPGLKQGWAGEEDRRRYHEAWSQPGALEAGSAYYKAAGLRVADDAGGAVGDYLPERAHPRVTTPTLVLYGEDDPYLRPVIYKDLDRWVDNLTMHSFAGAGHWIPLECADEVTALVVAFLSRRQCPES